MEIDTKLIQAWKDPYKLQLAIYDHLRLLDQMHVRSEMAEGGSPERERYEKQYMQELADLSILHDLLKCPDVNSRAAAEFDKYRLARYDKFCEKIKYNIEEEEEYESRGC